MIKEIFQKGVTFCNLNINPPFVIASGTVASCSDTILRLANSGKIGAITSKSISLNPIQGNHEPILAQEVPNSFTNAVGLANPGADVFSKELSEIYPLPNNVKLIVSVFGKNKEEFVKISKIMSKYADALELNLSCPHVEKGGAIIGRCEKLTEEITRAVKQIVDIPIIIKLTPTSEKIEKIAKAAERGGADAICAINTDGPGLILDNWGNPILSNKFGGISGEYIKPKGLSCINKISKVTNLPLIVMGGISVSKDIKDYYLAANKNNSILFGLGSSLAKSTEELFNFLDDLRKDILFETNNSETYRQKKATLRYSSYNITKIKKLCDDLKIFYFDKALKCSPGQFVFAYIPNKGEKPFSVADDNPLTLVVRKTGECREDKSQCFTSSLFNLKEGNSIGIRGPYGTKILDTGDKLLICGGTGAAPILFLAKNSKSSKIFMGSKCENQIIFEKEFSNLGELTISTEDGSKGDVGYITESLKTYLSKNEINSNIKAYICGPEKMCKSSVNILSKYLSLENIFISIERHMKCGIGLCGSCAIDGYRSCVDGPFFNAKSFFNSNSFGKYTRNKCGEKVNIF